MNLYLETFGCDVSKLFQVSLIESTHAEVLLEGTFSKEDSNLDTFVRSLKRENRCTCSVFIAAFLS